MVLTNVNAWIQPTLIATLIFGFAVDGGSNDSASNAPGSSIWRSGKTVPIAVVNGQASFDIPKHAPGAATLVIVSSLSKKPGPYHLSLTAKPTERARPLQLADDGLRQERVHTLSDLPTSPPPADGQPPARRTFHLLVRDGDVASASNYLPIVGVLRAVGDRIQVYVDGQDLERVDAPVLEDVVATFDREIYPKSAKTIGQARDIDRDGRFTVLISSWLNRLAGGRHSVDGFVRGADLDPDLRAPFSNRCDMVYLNASMPAGPHLRTVLAHEYTHAVTYTSKTFNGPSGMRNGQDEEGWLDEALAHLAEDLHGFSRSNLDYRISAYLSHPERYRLVVDDYYSADLFRSHGNRGGTYLFMRWCADQFGDNLLSLLVRSPDRGIENLEKATGQTFASLYRGWSAALYMNGLNPTLRSHEGYRTLDVRSPLDGWELAGPRAVHLSPNGQAECWDTEGTSSHYVIIEPSASGPVNVEVHGPSDAQLQVSAVPLPSNLGQLNLHLRATRDNDGTLLLRMRLSECNGTGVRLSTIAWEPATPAANPHTSAFRRGCLDSSQLGTVLGGRDLSAHQTLQSSPIRVERYEPDDGPLIVKVRGVDSLGRRVAAWAEIEHPAKEDDVAVGSNRRLTR